MDYNDLTESGSDSLDNEFNNYADEGMDNSEPLDEVTKTSEDSGAKDIKLEDVIKSYDELIKSITKE